MKREKVRKQSARSAKIKQVRVELILDTRYRQADGAYATAVRVYHDRKYLYIPTGWSMTPAEFGNMDERTERELGGLFDKVCSKVRELVAEGTFCLQSMKCQTEETNAGTLSALLVEKGRLSATNGTATNYRNAAKLLNSFRPDGLPLKSVNLTTVGEYNRWLQARGYSDASRNIHLSLLKAAINYGIYKGLLKDSQYPFKRNAHEIDKITLPKGGKRDTNWLTQDEVGRMHDYFTTTHDWAAGTFLFSYLCGGINLADILNLTYDDYYFDEGAFRFVREKIKNRTGQVTVIPVCERMKEVMHALGASEEKGGSPVPKIAGKDKATVASTLNTRLKNVARKAGIDKNISINTARHTFATVATKTGMPWNMMEAAMSHAAGGVSSHYVGAWTVDEMRPYFDRLL